MPMMIRTPGRPKKIAYAILGKPANMTSKESKTMQKINKMIVMQDTSRAR